MMEMFKWFANLSVLQGILLFVGVLLVLGLMPYYGIIYKCIGFWYRKEKGKILDFEFDVSPDHYLVTLNGKEYYKMPDEQGFLLNGGSIILTWRVTGAYRVDIDGVGKKLKGNGAYTIVNRKKPNYKMTIYTLQGKKSKILRLPVDQILDLDTTRLVNQKLGLTRDMMEPNTHEFTRSAYTGLPFTQTPPQVSISYPNASISYPENARMNYDSPHEGVDRNQMLSDLLEEQHVVKLNFLNAQKYTVNGKHIFEDVRERMHQEIIDNRE
jgi:hypothetical protein